MLRPLFQSIVLGTLAPCVALCAMDEKGNPNNWMQFRGPRGTGIAESDFQLPAALDVEKNLRWKVKVPSGHSSPIVVGDSIYLTAFETGKLSTICLSRQTGELRWRQDLPIDEFEPVHPQHGPASPTPVSDGERVFSIFGSFGIVAYDLNGSELWRLARDTRKNMFGSASSPIVVDGKLIVFAGGETESL
jgi:outer membrane protein assembly factor BamB